MTYLGHMIKAGDELELIGKKSNVSYFYVLQASDSS